MFAIFKSGPKGTDFIVCAEVKNQDGAIILQVEDGFKRYLNDIAKTRPLTRDEEGVLFDLVKQGNKAARDRLILSNMRFVLKCAMGYTRSPLPLPDMVNEGMMGLSKAVDMYDPTTGLKFISYAVWWIRAYITRAINEYGFNLVRKPANYYLEIGKANKKVKTGKPLTERERKLLYENQPEVSLDSQMTEGGSMWSDVIPGDDMNEHVEELERAEIETLLRKLIGTLAEPERTVITENFFENASVTEISHQMNLSGERIRQIKKRAINRIRGANYRNKAEERLSEELLWTR